MNQSVINTFRLSLLVLALVSAVSSKTYAVDIKSFFKRSDQQAVELLEQGQHDQATALFKSPQWRGVSQYRAGNYNEALDEFNQLEDNDSQTSDLYNRGTAAARAGDYDLAVSSLEQALENSPDSEDIRHNLDIARKLKELAEQNQQQQEQQGSGEQDQNEQNQGDQDAENEESDQSQNQQEQNQQGQNQQEGDNQSDDASSQAQQGDQTQDGDQQQSGELSADANPTESESDESSETEDAGESGELSELQRELESERESREASQNEAPSEADAEDTGNAAYADTSLSEDDQATEQWLRRIPDDASQLLRNKIRLNHMIEYPDVGHMPESW